MDSPAVEPTQRPEEGYNSPYLWFPGKYHPSREEVMETLVFMGEATFTIVAGPTLLFEIGTERVLNGIFSAAGYVGGSLATGEDIDAVDLGLAYAGGVLTPAGSGTTWVRKLTTGAAWGAASNATQSVASQGIDLLTGDQSEFSWSALAVDASMGGVGGVIGDPLGGRAESLLESAVRGTFRGVSESVQVAEDTGLSWIGSRIKEWWNSR